MKSDSGQRKFKQHQTEKRLADPEEKERFNKWQEGRKTQFSNKKFKSHIATGEGKEEFTEWRKQNNISDNAYKQNKSDITRVYKSKMQEKYSPEHSPQLTKGDTTESSLKPYQRENFEEYRAHREKIFKKSSFTRSKSKEFTEGIKAKGATPEGEGPLHKEWRKEEPAGGPPRNDRQDMSPDQQDTFRQEKAETYATKYKDLSEKSQASFRREMQSHYKGEAATSTAPLQEQQVSPQQRQNYYKDQVHANTISVGESTGSGGGSGGGGAGSGGAGSGGGGAGSGGGSGGGGSGGGGAGSGGGGSGGGGGSRGDGSADSTLPGRPAGKKLERTTWEHLKHSGQASQNIQPFSQAMSQMFNAAGGWVTAQYKVEAAQYNGMAQLDGVLSSTFGQLSQSIQDSRNKTESLIDSILKTLTDMYASYAQITSSLYRG